MTTAFAATAPQLGLYPVVDSVSWIERLLAAGVRTIQLRIKDLPDREADDSVRKAIALGRRYRPRRIRHMAYTWVRRIWR